MGEYGGVLGIRGNNEIKNTGINFFLDLCGGTMKCMFCCVLLIIFFFVPPVPSDPISKRHIGCFFSFLIKMCCTHSTYKLYPPFFFSCLRPGVFTVNFAFSLM